MGWWLLRLSAKVWALLRLSVNFLQLRLTKKLTITFFCFKGLNINKPVFLYLQSKIKDLGSSRDKMKLFFSNILTFDRSHYFEVIYIFRKNAVLNICRYLKSFYTHKKIINIFLEFHYYLFSLPKIIEIGWTFHSEKRKSKT